MHFVSKNGKVLRTKQKMDFIIPFILNKEVFEGDTFDQEKMPFDSIIVIYLPDNPFLTDHMSS
jgi:hypothetical protein